MSLTMRVRERTKARDLHTEGKPGLKETLTEREVGGGGGLTERERDREREREILIAYRPQAPRTSERETEREILSAYRPQAPRASKRASERAREREREI